MRTRYSSLASTPTWSVWYFEWCFWSSLHVAFPLVSHSSSFELVPLSLSTIRSPWREVRGVDSACCVVQLHRRMRLQELTSEQQRDEMEGVTILHRWIFPSNALIEEIDFCRSHGGPWLLVPILNLHEMSCATFFPNVNGEKLSWPCFQLDSETGDAALLHISLFFCQRK